MLKGRERARAIHFELTHVAHVEQTGGAARRPVLFDDAGVLHRHLPATERHHSRAGRDVLLVERRPPEHFIYRRTAGGGAPAPPRPAARTTPLARSRGAA